MNTANTPASLELQKLTKTLDKAKIELEKATKEFSSLSDRVVQEAYELEVLTSKKEAVEVDINEAERKSKAELSIRIIENEDNVLNGLLEDRGLACISLDEMKVLKADVAKLRNDNASKYDDGFEDGCTTTKQAQFEEILTLKSKHSVEVAKKDAEIYATTAKVAYLESAVKQLQDTLDADREAQVDIAKNASHPEITVNSK